MDRLGESEEATAFERMLLESASEDVPSEAARARTLATLGVGAGVVATGALAGAAQVATVSAARGAGAASVTKSGSVAAVVLLKYLGAGAVAGVVTAGTLVVATTPRVPARPVVTAPAPGVTKGATPAVERTAPASLRDPGAAQPLPSPEPPPSFVAPAPEAANAGAAPAAPRIERVAASSPGVSSNAGNAPPVFDASHVVEEVHSLDHARAALAASDPRTALARLAAHDARFPRGTLEPEAVVLRVRALLALGRRSEAAAVAKGFLATHPESAQAARLQALVGP